MRCERYWRDGILLVEQGRPDPHRETCLDCQREHRARGDLVRAFRDVGGQGGNPWWQARVWSQIEALRPEPDWDGEVAGAGVGTRTLRRPRRGSEAPAWLPWASAFAAASALVLFVWTQGLLHHDGDLRPRFGIIPSAVAMRSTSASLGDRAALWVRVDQEARIYHGERLLLRCTPSNAALTRGCSRDGDGLMAEYQLEVPGEYHLVIAPAGIPAPEGSLDRDLAAITASGGSYELHAFAVR